MVYRQNPNYPPSYWDAPYHQPTMYQPPFPFQEGNEVMNAQSPFQQFAKPKQPADWFNTMYQQQQNQSQGYQQQTPPPQQPVPGIISQFQDDNGQINVDKMLTTVGQLANTYHQVQPIVQQFGNFIKNFR